MSIKQLILTQLYGVLGSLIGIWLLALLLTRYGVDVTPIGGLLIGAGSATMGLGFGLARVFRSEFE